MAADTEVEEMWEEAIVAYLLVRAVGKTTEFDARSPCRCFKP